MVLLTEERIVPRISLENILSNSALKLVITFIPKQTIIAFLPKKTIGTSASEERIISDSTLQLIIAFSPIEEIRRACSARFEWIIQSLTEQSVIAGSAEQHIRSIAAYYRIRIVTTVEDVVALVAVELIDAGSTAERIITAAAKS